MIDPAALPYRPASGVMLINDRRLVWVGQRIDSTLEAWQMPQGGLDPGEDPYACGLRELYEETNIRSVAHVATIDDWLRYDIPREIVGQAWKGKYRGQTQKWFALRFTGDDSEIDVAHPGGGHHEPEFVAWRWEPMQNVPNLVVPFKRKTYERVVKEFAEFAKPVS